MQLKRGNSVNDEENYSLLMINFMELPEFGGVLLFSQEPTTEPSLSHLYPVHNLIFYYFGIHFVLYF
jgi:hypothetical protein